MLVRGIDDRILDWEVLMAVTVDAPAEERWKVQQRPRPHVRLGVILPSVNTVVEPWFARSVPDGVSLHAARMLLANSLSPEVIREMDSTDGINAARQIASCRPASVGYCCTASSLVQGPAYDRHLRDQLTRVCGVPATTGAYAIQCALIALNARDICVISPYGKELDDLEHRYFEECGFRIKSAGNIGITDSFGLAEPSAETLVELARRTWRADAEAMVITCLNTYSHEVVEFLEERLGVPVVTATQATLWHLLELAGAGGGNVPCGRLFRHRAE